MWRIYYADGSTFDSSMGGPEDAPVENVQIIAELRDGRRIAHSLAEDYYIWDGEKWETSTYIHDDKITLTGNFMDLTEFKAMRERAFEWLTQR